MRVQFFFEAPVFTNGEVKISIYSLPIKSWILTKAIAQRNINLHMSLNAGQLT